MLAREGTEKPPEYSGFNLYLEFSAVMRLKFELGLIDNNALVLYCALLFFGNRHGWQAFNASESQLLAYCSFSHATFIKARRRLVDARLLLYQTDRRNAPTYFLVPVYKNIAQFMAGFRQNLSE